MLYLNSIENAEASPTEEKYAICHEEVPSMLHIPELAPSRTLLAKWQSNAIDWEEFREQFTDEMRAEYRKEENRLKGLIKYSLENDVTLHSPEPSGEQTYRAILEGIINVICKSQGQTGHVINLASEPIEDSQPQEDIASLFGNTLHELNLTKADNTRLLIENAELKKDIQSFQTEGDNTGKENDELKKQIDQLEEQINTHEATIDDLRRTLSEKKEIISDKDREIQSLQTENRNKDKKNDELRQQVDQLQEINTHPEIRDIAVKATGNDQEFEEHFRTLDIDENLPVDLRKWLEVLLKQALSMSSNNKTGLSSLIHKYTNFDVEYSTASGRFDKSDNYLAHVIRTQGNLTVHEDPDERTEMGRAFCCFFAAALLAPKLSKVDHTNTEPLKSIKPTPNDAEVHYSHGIAHGKKGDHDSAIAEYTKAIKLKSDHAGAYRNRGTVYYHKGDYASALKDYTKAIALKPDYAITYRNRGTAHYRKGDYASAIADLTKAIELKPDYAEAYNNRGHAYQKTGDSARAQADFDKTRQLRK